MFIQIGNAYVNRKRILAIALLTAEADETTGEPAHDYLEITFIGEERPVHVLFKDRHSRINSTLPRVALSGLPRSLVSLIQFCQKPFKYLNNRFRRDLSASFATGKESSSQLSRD
jgi:hypothetical protein